MLLMIDLYFWIVMRYIVNNIVLMTDYFCYLPIHNLAESIIGWPIFAVCMAILIRTVYQYRIVRQVSHSKHVQMIYNLLICWNVIYLCRLLFAQVIYLFVPSKNNGANLEIISKSYFIVDITSVFILQCILILIPYNWVRNVISIFNQLSTMDDSQNSYDHIRFQMKTQKILKVYIYLRFMVYGIIIPFCFIPYVRTVDILAQIILALLLGEVVMVTIILGLGIHAVKNNKKLNQLIDQEQIKLMINQYSILIACTIIRLGVDAIYFYIKFLKGIKQKDCQVVSKVEFPHISMFIVEPFLTHFLPIFVVQRIYKISKTDYDLTKSLLAADQYQSQNIASQEYCLSK